MKDPRRWMLLLAGVWLGLLLTVAAIATPAPFAALSRPEAGRVVAIVLAREAGASVLFAAAILLLQRWQVRKALSAGEPVRQFDARLGLAAAALACTLAGYYALQPLMADARAGQGSLSFAQLHAISAVFFALKVALVAFLAFSLSRPASSSC
jgi:Domain of unknown function (DUF4149)